MFKRACGILNNENVSFEKEVVAEVVRKYFPDNRRILNELQRYSATGAIDTGILSNFTETTLQNLVSFLKEKNFTEVRKWVAEHNDIETAVIFRQIYDMCSEFMAPSSVPRLVVILAEYQYKDAFVADHEINLTACLTEIMANCEFN